MLGLIQVALTKISVQFVFCSVVPSKNIVFLLALFFANTVSTSFKFTTLRCRDLQKRGKKTKLFAFRARNYLLNFTAVVRLIQCPM